jgi:DNA-binding protein YbaB
MSVPMPDDMDAALADLRAEQARIEQIDRQLSGTTTSSTSKDRMVTVTVDSQGQLVDLKISGTRYRQIAPAELTARILETAKQAQELARSKTMEAFSEMLPPGLAEAMKGGFNLDGMIDAAVQAVNDPMARGNE